EALFDDPDALRLEPQVSQWNDADRQQLIADEGWAAEEASALQTGAEWAAGFMLAVDSFPGLWAPPDDEELAAQLTLSLDCIRVLCQPPGAAAIAIHIAQHYPPGVTPDRESMFVDGCLAAQDLRMLWVDAVPRGETRRVAPTPGRNEPCPCGSGKKYKRCHGAVA
ncbi:MAG: SEC-C metal-binding domain-containing protein, partial [Rubrivivax sp.]